MIWFSSDYHISHANIIKYCNRPYANTYEMNEALIANHNSCVKPEDDWYHLGDFCMGDRRKVAEYLSRLNGRKHMIKGNHDKALLDEEPRKHFEWLRDYYELYIPDPTIKGGKQFIVLFHYPLRSWNHSMHNAWHLYGHEHGNLKDSIGKSFDVGVDCFNYHPVSYDMIKAMMAERNRDE